MKNIFSMSKINVWTDRIGRALHYAAYIDRLMEIEIKRQ